MVNGDDVMKSIATATKPFTFEEPNTALLLDVICVTSFMQAKRL